VKPLTTNHATRATDRRGAIRFEVVGTLRGTLAADAALHVRDLGRGGALVEAPWPLEPESVHTVGLDTGALVFTCEARVRHVRRSDDTAGHLIGLEFLSLDPMQLDALDAALADAPPDAIGAPSR
jgi:hypothetical protein